MNRPPQDAPAVNGRAWVLHPDLRDAADDGLTTEDQLSEAVALGGAIDLIVDVARTVPVRRPNAATLFGRGTVAALGEAIQADQPGLAVVNTSLSPVQQRNLERAWQTKVIDRTGLILEIFGARARTHEGRLQVELAALTYQRSRLVRSWTHLERQRGGRGFLAGPGESQIESDRRQIDQRIDRLRRQLEQVARRRDLHRSARRRVPYSVAALVGYTNAGKSTLFNRLTGAGVRAEDKLFATLDPTMRAVELPSGRTVILSDTVGFISNLPTDLVAAFRATLEEVVAADLILHVRDVSHPNHRQQKKDVETVLRQLGLDGGARIIEVRNKIDLLAERPAAQNGNGHANAAATLASVAVSALDGAGCDDLRATIDRQLSADHGVYHVALDVADGAAAAWLYRYGEVIERRDSDDSVHLTVTLDPVTLEQFRQRHPTSRARLVASV